MPYKRRRTMPGGPTKRRRMYARAGAAAIRAIKGRRAYGRGKGLSRAIKRTMLRMAETKHVYPSPVNNLVMRHNVLELVMDNIFATVQGTDAHNRLGDKIFAKSISFKMYFENQQYRPKASYLVLVLRNKNNPNAGIADGENIFEPVTTSKNLDFIDYNKYQVIYSKRVTVNDAGSTIGTNSAMSGLVDGTAQVISTLVSNPARYHSFKLRLNRTIDYLEGGSSVPTTQRYSLCVIPYSTFTTTTDGATYPVGHVSVVSKFYFKDP